MDRFGETDGIVAEEVLFVAFAQVVHINIYAVRVHSAAAGAYQMGDRMTGFREGPAVDRADDACTNDQDFHFLFSFSKLLMCDAL
jgi:hypothetical protein